MTQETSFLNQEGDQWYHRNKAVMDTRKSDPCLDAIKTAGIVPNRVIEIGCSKGWRLKALYDLYGCSVTGIDPSAAALLDGERAYPMVNFIRATADNIPLEEPFDLVIVSFVLHWVSRHLLFKAFAEMDRLTRASGYLLINDFYSEAAQVVPYHHMAGLFTYKQNYARVFIDSHSYRLKHLSSFMVDSGTFEGRESACQILEKL